MLVKEVAKEAGEDARSAPRTFYMYECPTTFEILIYFGLFQVI